MSITGVASKDKGRQEIASCLGVLTSGMEGPVDEVKAFISGFGARVFHHQFMGHSPRPFVSTEGRFIGFAVGELYPRPGERSDLGLLFERFLDPGFSDWGDIDGQFVFAAYDCFEQSFFLVNDRFGSWPLYFLVSGGALFFSSRLGNLFRILPRRPDLSRRGVAELIFFGHHFGESALFEDIRCLPPASVLRFEGGEAEISRYWRAVYDPDPSVSELELAELLTSAIRRQTEGGGRKAVLLSGGLDSRVVACESSKLCPELSAFTFGDHDSMDVAYARSVCSRLGIVHHHLAFDPEQWAGSLPEVARQAEGEADIMSFRSLQFHQRMSRLCDTLLTGMSGDMIMGSFIESERLTSSAEDEVAAFAFAFSLQHPLELLAGLFQPGLSKQMENFCREIVIESLAGNPNQLDADKLDAWNLENRQRRFILIGPNTDRYRFNVRSPFYDYDLFDFTLRIPAAKRKGEALYLKALWRIMPQLRKVPWQKTGLPPDPIPARLLARKALRKLKRKIAPSAYYPKPSFVNAGDLVRRGFQSGELIQSLVQQPRKWHEMINPGAVKTVIEEHFQGARDHAVLLTKFLTLAYTEDLFLDG